MKVPAGDVVVGGGRVASRPPQPSKAAFDTFFADVWPDLVGFCHTLTADANAAEEICQEALARVFARYALLREPRPYAFRVAANLVRARWRQLHSHRHLIEHESTPMDARVEVHDAVQRLPERLRAVVLLHYFADLPIGDVARQLHRPVGTIKRRLHEARKQLATALGEPL